MKNQLISIFTALLILFQNEIAAARPGFVQKFLGFCSSIIQSRGNESQEVKLAFLTPEKGQNSSAENIDLATATKLKNNWAEIQSHVLREASAKSRFEVDQILISGFNQVYGSVDDSSTPEKVHAAFKAAELIVAKRRQFGGPYRRQDFQMDVRLDALRYRDLGKNPSLPKLAPIKEDISDPNLGSSALNSEIQPTMPTATFVAWLGLKLAELNDHEKLIFLASIANYGFGPLDLKISEPFGESLISNNELGNFIGSIESIAARLLAAMNTETSWKYVAMSAQNVPLSEPYSNMYYLVSALFLQNPSEAKVRALDSAIAELKITSPRDPWATNKLARVEFLKIIKAEILAQGQTH